MHLSNRQANIKMLNYIFRLNIKVVTCLRNNRSFSSPDILRTNSDAKIDGENQNCKLNYTTQMYMFGETKSGTPMIQKQK